MSGHDDVRAVRDQQGHDGNWDYSPYMRGLYNGLECALAIMEGRDPEYRDEPAEGYREARAVLIDPADPRNWPVSA